MDERTRREKKAYDEDCVWEASNTWHKKFSHVFASPNTLRNEEIFYNKIKENLTGKRVLEIGCGRGRSSQLLYAFGADYVYGIDVSEKSILEAKNKEIKGKLEFSNKDIMQPVEGQFDVICGRSVLHHIDYKPVLKRLYTSNLNRNGFMIFMEPLGSNLFMKIWFFLGKKAHTPDEKPLYKKDLLWLRDTFKGSEIFPINYFSFPFGIISSILFSNADNFLMHLCDKVDFWIAKNIKSLNSNFRQAIIVIKKI